MIRPISFAPPRPLAQGQFCRLSRVALFGTLCLLAVGRPAFAQTSVSWANVGSAFATDSNWVGGTAPVDNTTSSIATFGNVTVQPELASNRSVARLAFSGTTDVTLAGSGTLTLGGSNSLINSSSIGTKTVSAPLNFSVFRSTIENNGDLRLGGPITGSILLTFSDAGTGAGGLISGDISTSALTKSGPGLLTLTGSSNFSSGLTVSGGTFRLGASERLSNAAAVTVEAGGAFDLAGWSERIGDLRGAGSVTLGSGTLTTGSRSSTTFSGSILGSGGLVKEGAFETFTLTGSNSFTGGTTVSAGLLAIGNGGTTGSLVGDIASSGTIAFNRSDATAFSGSISGTGSLLKQGAGQLTLTATHSYTGSTTVAGGTLTLGAPNLLADTTRVVVAAGAALNLAGYSDAIGALTGDGAVILGSGTLAVGSANVVGFDETLFSGSISGSGGLVKVGSGDLQLAGTNSYTGITMLSSGTLTLRSGSALPPTTALVMAAGATLYKPFNHLDNAATIIGSLSGAGNVTLESGTLTVGTDGSTTTFAGKISGGRIVKDGAGTQTITGTISSSIHALGGDLVLGATAAPTVVSKDILVTSNLYAVGSTTIDSTFITNQGYFEISGSAAIVSSVITGPGSLYASGSATFGSATITVSNIMSLWDSSTAGTAGITNNALLLFNATSSAGSANITNNATLQLRDASSAAGATITNASAGVIDVQYSSAASIGALSGGGRLTLGNRTATIGARGTSTTFSGTISGTGGSLVKTGTGTLTLSAANTYTGTTTIAGGRLALTGSGSIGTGGLSLGTDGVFDLAALVSGTYVLPETGDLVGSGTLTGSGKTLAVLGSFKPGNSPGTVTVATGLTLDLANSGTSVFQITSPLYTAGSFDLVNGAGSVIFGGILYLDFSGGAYAKGTDVLQLFANTGGLSGSFSAVNYTGLAAGQSATFNSTTGYVTIVPEPRAYAISAMATAGLAGLILRRKRRTAGRTG